MSIKSMTADCETEPLAEEIGFLRDEVRGLAKELAQLRSEVYRTRTGRRWEGLVRSALGIRLGVYEQYRPRAMRVPRSYRQPISLCPPAPLISIVTPAFNHGSFLERTIRSVIDQAYPRLEYIVQDGGSRDETPAILNRYRHRLHRAVSVRDGGQTNALNLGFTHASGEIMAYLNSDDLLLPGCLHYVARFFQDHPDVDVVYGHRVFVDSTDLEIGRWVLPRHDSSILAWADYVPQETMFWRRRIWNRIGAHFDESFSFAMDWDVLLRFRDCGAKMVRLPRFLGAFRVHDQQKSQAQLANIGAREMTRLRIRCHGREVTRSEIRHAILGYLLRHSLYDRLYWWKVLSY